MVGLVGGQPGRSAQQTRQQGNQSDADQGNTTARDELFYPQLGVKLCSMAGSGTRVVPISATPPPAISCFIPN